MWPLEVGPVTSQVPVDWSFPSWCNRAMTTAKPSWPRCYLVPHDAARRDSDSVVRCFVLQRAADRRSETQEPRLWERVSCGNVAARYVPPALFATQT
jgi:hypothetical protein